MKRTPLKRESKKQAERRKIYKELADEYKYLHPYCEFPGCRTKTKDIHHKARRNGNNMFRHFMAVCRRHHDWIESHTREARELGYLIEDDPRRE